MAPDKSWMGIENRKDLDIFMELKVPFVKAWNFKSYTIWYFHGESLNEDVDINDDPIVNDDQDFDDDMIGLVNDIYGGSNVNIGMDSNSIECELSKLAAIVKLLHMKSFHRWINRSFDDLLGLLRELIPNGKQNLPESYNSARNRQKIRQSQNSGVMSRGDNNSPDKEYYGTLMDVWELQYSGRNQISLFKCEWFDVRHKETGYIDDVCEIADDNEVYQEEENDMHGRPTRPLDNDDDIVDLNRVDVDPEEVMASVSKRKKNNRKMPPGLKSCISSAHGDSSEETLPPPNQKICLTLLHLKESRQSLRTNIENDPVGVSNAPSLSSPASNVVGCLASGRGLYKGIDLDKLTNGKKDKLIIFIPQENIFDQLDYFDVSPESPEKWKKLEEMQKVKPDTAEIKKAKFEFYCFYEMKILYRKWKYKLHLKYLKYSSDDERLQHVPEGLTVDTWKEMFKVFANEDFQMDEEIGEVPYASKVWMATHGFLDEQGQTQWHDPESSRIYEEMQRIEKQPTNDNETGPTPMMS
ncbi:hypothetical protein GH714_023441 [Hevea brasiliensis]|uniref:DUF4216 domain-containing protein n=1 Tax=Hevea brasiliensis TaxID=3981 RepID=A0A6A6KQT9_HEVBR|nr:hypothetical protein GH714_023441 [Hevea brasiliensis]